MAPRPRVRQPRMEKRRGRWLLIGGVGAVGSKFNSIGLPDDVEQELTDPDIVAISKCSRAISFLCRYGEDHGKAVIALQAPFEKWKTRASVLKCLAAKHRDVFEVCLLFDRHSGDPRFETKSFNHVQVISARPSLRHRALRDPYM